MDRHEGDSREGTEAQFVAPLIVRDHSRCRGCLNCVRHCPARALKAVDGHVEVIAERCVSCGLCVVECTTGSHSVRDDTPRVRELLAGDRPVIALLASEHVAAMHPRSPGETERALEALGFAGVETTVLGEEIVAAAYSRLHLSGDTSLPRLRSTCPVATGWVRRFHPWLTPALVPVAPPYIAQARLVRSLYSDRAAVVYVSPCWARKDEAVDPAFEGSIDVAIGFDELERLLAEGEPRPFSPMRRPQVSRQESATDGFPRKTLSATTLDGDGVSVVRGLDDLDRLLTAIVRGETAPDVVDMLNCEGCIDGPCVNRDMSVYAKRAVDAAARERTPAPPVDARTILSALPKVDIRRRFTPSPAPTREPSAEEIDAVLAAGEFASRAETIDCGACGYDTCVEHAAAICLDRSTWDVCMPLQKKRVTRERDHLATVASTDPLTGLLNRRAFDERLRQEVDRHQRYGGDLSVVMFDLDGFKLVNDRHGHASGDALLRAAGILVSSHVRSSDAAGRVGGDEFALILPGVNKTGAWAAAEKLRAAMATLTVAGSDGSVIGVTVSVGVASLGGRVQEAVSLLGAADEALLAAKRTGRDRVELAGG